MRKAVVFLAIVLAFSLEALAEPAMVIVFPLDTASKNSALTWLSEGISESISRQISGDVKAMTRKDRIELVEGLDLPPGARLSRGSMIRVAQKASADLIILGNYAGSDMNLRIGVRILNMKTLKLSGEIVANGPLSALPQMENELAWLILRNTGLIRNASREKFQEKTRKVRNSAYALYIQSLNVPNEKEQFQLLIKAVEADREFPEAQLLIGRQYFLKKDCVTAKRHLPFAQKDAALQVEAGFMLGTCEIQANQHLEAIQHFYKILQVARPYEVLNNLGVAYLRKGDNTLASNALVEARSLSHGDSSVVLNLAITRHVQGNDTVALAVVEEGIKSHPQSAMLQFMLGYLLERQGERDKAATAMSKARSLGAQVDKLVHEEPKTWSRLVMSLGIAGP